MSVYKILVPDGRIGELHGFLKKAGIEVFAEGHQSPGYVPGTLEFQLAGQVSDRSVEDAAAKAGCSIVSTPRAPA